MISEWLRSRWVRHGWLSASAVLGLSCSGPIGGGVPAVQAKRAVRSGTVRVNAGVDQAFQLFTPLGETRWSPEWRPRMVYPVGTGAQRDLVFLVPHHHGGEAVWIVDAYDPAAHRIEYVYVFPEHVACRISVHCEADGPDRTLARVTYTMTGLSEGGNHMVEELSEESFTRRMGHWEQLIATGLAKR